MPALTAWPGVVGYLVSLIAQALQPCHAGPVHIVHRIIIRQRGASLLHPAVQRRTLFQYKGICGYVVYSQQPAPFYAVDILFFALSRQAVHEVDIYVFEPGSP